VAAQQTPLVGSWRLISAQSSIADGGKIQVSLMQNPKGYLILTPQGRMMTVATFGDRKKIYASQDDFRQLLTTMTAYTGRYRIEGSDFVTMVDVSWYEVWTGTEQRRHYKIEGDKLTIVSAPQPVGAGPQANAMVTVTLVWEREN